jgi:hypothetical protein
MRRRARSVVALTLAAVLATAVGGDEQSSAATQADEVTMHVGQRFQPANPDARILVFSGSVSTSADGEVVDVLGRDCGQRDYRLIQSAQTRPGGGWSVEHFVNAPPWNRSRVESGTTFRARWKNASSATYLWRVPAELTALKVRGRRAWRVAVSPPSLSNLSMKGKLVVLQRRSGGRWVRYRVARLVYKPSLTLGALNHEAVFAVPKRGLRLRALLPAKSAAPCYLASATLAWRS